MDIRANRLNAFAPIGAPWGGGVYPVAVAVTDLLLLAQRHLDIKGDIAEIGVLAGGYLSGLCRYLGEDENAVAIDPYFVRPELKDITRMRLEAAAGSSSKIAFVHRSSMELAPRDIVQSDRAGFRFFSVDGDHSYEAVRNDLGLARDTIVDGGIVAVDDYFDPLSPGVSVAMTTYFLEDNGGRLAPLISGGNKVFLITATHHQKCRQFLLEHSDIVACCGGPDVQWHRFPTMLVTREPSPSGA